jgi:hypothetical protein
VFLKGDAKVQAFDVPSVAVSDHLPLTVDFECDARAHRRLGLWHHGLTDLVARCSVTYSGRIYKMGSILLFALKAMSIGGPALLRGG